MNFVVVGIILVAILSYRYQALTKSGAYAAVCVAFLIYFGLSLAGLLLLAAFFLSSTLIGRWTKGHSEENEMVEKGDKRDFSQVVANGGWPAIAALLYGITGNDFFYLAFIASLGAATSDTWASEIGRMSRGKPIHVLTGRKLLHGQSGGITFIGTVGALGGSAFISALGWLLYNLEILAPISHYPFLLILLAAFLGQWADSFAGAVMQGSFKCSICQGATEKRIHCGEKTILIKGMKTINNDVVNHICTLSAVGFIWVFQYFF
ncbi:MAG: DUF92 domain-containing protein [Bacillus sp. (in: Bacteria)]|nr:DUF92 domain-containing protein [Bacillus sp. (in: firmicutes)]